VPERRGRPGNNLAGVLTGNGDTFTCVWRYSQQRRQRGGVMVRTARRGNCAIDLLALWLPVENRSED
jgi:hypothetical protein